MMNLYRLIFGIAITFFLFPWVDKVGLNWVFGTQAFLSVFALGMIAAVMMHGPALRKLSFIHAASEEGVRTVRSLNERADNI